ncbi:hypothetical protein [Brassicibacter mesophilus]|uniref:hypothetical protein n=1 Tax=Brassicibacter mesophilus TaxID=745119 RepID=UPI003D1AEC1C
MRVIAADYNRIQNGESRQLYRHDAVITEKAQDIEISCANPKGSTNFPNMPT